MNETAQETTDKRLTAKWAVDPLGIGTPFNVETEDGNLSVCIVQEAPGPRGSRNAIRAALAHRIVAEHNSHAALETENRALVSALERARDCIEACERIARDFADGSFDGVTIGAIEDAVAAARAKGER